MEWLGAQSAWYDALAAREAWRALGGAMGVSQVGGHAHCQLPAAQYGVVNAFARRFRLGDPAGAVDVHQTDGGFPPTPTAWVDWQTPRLR